MMTDPIADMLTRIRNANVAMHDQVNMPASKQKVALATILQREGYIKGYEVNPSAEGPGDVLTISMKYSPDRDRTISGVSTSRFREMLDPTTLICAPGATISLRRMGSRAAVVVQMRSASFTALSTDSQSSTRTPRRASIIPASRRPRSAVRFHSRSRRTLRTASMASA